MGEEIGVKLSREAFLPGERLEGQAGWNLPRAPKNASIRLFWRTHGKGSEDLAIVSEQKVAAPQAAQLLRFAFDLPIGPYSFEGRLITLQWGVEVLADKASHCAWFQLGPDGKACRLPG
jgi:hypothetical protein